MGHKPVKFNNFPVRQGCRLARLAVLLVAALAVLLAGCEAVALSAEVSVKLQRDERWSVRAEIVYAQVQYQMVGSLIDQGLNQELARIRGLGARANTRKQTLRSGDVRYTITASGQGYPSINAAFFDGQPAFSVVPGSDPPQVKFSYVPLGTFFGAALNRSFSLNGGQVLSSNGMQASKGTVSWVNPTNVMQATLTPSSALSLTTLIAGLGVLAAVGLLVAVVRKAGRKRCPYCGARLPRSAQYCGVCGNSLQSDY